MKGLEILELKPVGEYWQVRTALNGKLAIPFDVHKSIRSDNFPNDAEFESYLGRQTAALIDAYGDARERRPDPAAEFIV